MDGIYSVFQHLDTPRVQSGFLHADHGGFAEAGRKPLRPASRVQWYRDMDKMLESGWVILPVALLFRLEMLTDILQYPLLSSSLTLLQPVHLSSRWS